jgi:hypothetical protein
MWDKEKRSYIAIGTRSNVQRLSLCKSFAVHVHILRMSMIDLLVALDFSLD